MTRQLCMELNISLNVLDTANSLGSSPVYMSGSVRIELNKR